MNVTSLFLKKLDRNFFDYIKSHINSDIYGLILKTDLINPTEKDIAITQISCRQAIKDKLPSLYNNERFLFPSKLLAEQSTSEILAKFHASLFKDCKNILDMTAGLLVDSYFISAQGINVTAIELNKESYEYGLYNLTALESNINLLLGNSSEFLKETGEKYDAIFVDPARRGDNNKKLYMIEDCSPNIDELIEEFKSKSDFVIIKASPMLDIALLKNKYKDISDIWILSINNECKEILFKFDFKPSESSPLIIHTVNYGNKHIQVFDYEDNNMENVTMNIAFPQINQFLYEPNSSIMKSGAFKKMASKFPSIYKLHNNTHLFVGKYPLAEFPGRRFIIEEIIPYKEKEIRKIKNKYKSINVSVRNFRLGAEQLKMKLKVKDGGEKYLFGTTFNDEKPYILICSKYNDI